MSEDMNLSLNGHSKIPPGFRFHPTEEELLRYYLAKKVSSRKIDLDVIRDVDLNKLEPWDIQERCNIGSTPQNDWYLFSHKDKKYPTGTRTNRATAAGFWKATGRDKVIRSSSRRIGMRKTLVFYGGRAPHGKKSEWIMHEYRLELNDDDNNNNVTANKSKLLSSGSDEGWVVCRVFKKKNYHKFIPRNEGELINAPSIILAGYDDRTPGFMHLPSLESPTLGEDVVMASSDWAAMDRLVAHQLDGQLKGFDGSVDDEELSFWFEDRDHEPHLLGGVMNNSDEDIWNFGCPSSASSSSDPLCRLSV